MARLILTLAFVFVATVAAQEPESSFGFYHGTPIGNVWESLDVAGMKGTECVGFVMARGQLQANDNQIPYGNFVIANGPEPAAYVTMPAGAVAMLRVRELDRKDVELVLRPIPQRTLERIR